MKRIFLLLIVLFFQLSCKEKDQKTVFLPDSNGRINDLTVIMSSKSWNGYLGKKTRGLLSAPYKGLPIDEPQFSLKFIPEEIFSGFARNSRNIIWFVKDSIGSFQLFENMMAKPQLVAKVTGEDEKVQEFYLRENIQLYRESISETEEKEKIRRIKKSRSSSLDTFNRFKISLTYPSAYLTVKDTTNFTWIQKRIKKGHMNIILYSLPIHKLKGVSVKKRIIEIRDSIGKRYIPGRVLGSHMITEQAYRPFFYKTKLNGKLAYLTIGTWEVKNDFMAGPFINYIINDSINNRWMVIEGFTFAPSANKRDHMFELKTILKSAILQ